MDTITDLCMLILTHWSRPRHLVLFSGRKYDTLPSHINTVSPLYEQIVARMQDAESPLSEYALAVTDSSHAKTSPPKKQWDGQANRFDKPESSSDAEEEAYGAVVYPDRKSPPFPITIDNVKSGKLDRFLGELPAKKIIEKLEDVDKLRLAKEMSSPSVPEIDVFVCVSHAWF